MLVDASLRFNSLYSTPLENVSTFMKLGVMFSNKLSLILLTELVVNKAFSMIGFVNQEIVGFMDSFTV